MSAPVASNPGASVRPPPSSSSVHQARGSIPSASAPNNARGSSNTTNSPVLPPSFQSNSSRPQASNSASASASRSTTSPPTTTNATASAATGSQPRATMDLNPTLPSRTTQLHIDEARAALVASMSNMLDSELQSRASLLHSNAAALNKQERDVIKGTEALRKENDKLEKLARDTERKIKELGNVQNWAEVLERDFLVLEETMRLVREGSRSNDESCSECSRSSWSGSYSADDSREGSRRGSVTGEVDGDGDGDGDAKNKQTRGRELNGNSLVCGAVKSGERIRGDDVHVTVDKAVAESISEAMATDLHEPLNFLSLSSLPSESQGSSVKGKEPAIEDNRIDIGSISESTETREHTVPPHTSLPEDAATADQRLDPSTAMG
ncbi:hypothetical protein F5Y05DRAFT_96920 [Hypoxylon sp. FL0543]|nr:hypothetical protein F5Y05DRAFT_96920 [Hypoxylon sp. FL0543]